MYRFTKGQIVYILGRYKAKVIDANEENVTCDVYEGLAPNQKAPQRATYGPGIVEPNQATKQP